LKPHPARNVASADRDGAGISEDDADDLAAQMLAGQV